MKMAKSDDPNDPKGLIFESFRIEGILPSECRTIFLDWALSMPEGADTRDAVAGLLERYKGEPSDHPMKATLKEGLEGSKAAMRRGGRAARLGY